MHPLFATIPVCLLHVILFFTYLLPVLIWKGKLEIPGQRRSSQAIDWSLVEASQQWHWVLLDYLKLNSQADQTTGGHQQPWKKPALEFAKLYHSGIHFVQEKTYWQESYWEAWSRQIKLMVITSRASMQRADFLAFDCLEKTQPW